MPFANFTKIREVSSEDNIHLAENLIKSQPGKKWKTKSAGEKSAYVILEMSESQEITGIDIGNEHSAFVEILVGKSSCTPEDFREILITCSFMTPPESKASNNTNRVRCFNKEALVPNAVNNKWSLVKIVCTQPFNKHVQYGLSFIKVHVNAKEKPDEPKIHKNLVPDHFRNVKLCNTQASGDSFNKLKFRDVSPDSEGDSSSSLFNRWKKSKDINEKTTAASIRLAAKNPTTDIQKLNNSQTVKLDYDILDRNRDEVIFGNENFDCSYNQGKLERLSKQIKEDKDRRRLEIEKEKEKELNKKKHKILDCKSQLEKSKCVKKVEEITNPSSSKNTTPISNRSDKSLERPKKRGSSPIENPVKKIKKGSKYAPFNQLLKGVVLVISGIQNPDRGDLRNKALAMGAKYKGDWDSTCTHLLCAFKNTPKYNQVKGKGKIITRSWIEKCYSLKKYLPWRRYALDNNELSKPESDEEILDESVLPQTCQVRNDNDLSSALKGNSRSESENPNNIYLYDLDDRLTNSITINNEEASSECDTDDEIERVAKSASSVNVKTKTFEANNGWAILCLGWHRDIRRISPDSLGHVNLGTNFYPTINTNSDPSRCNRSKIKNSIASSNLAKFLAWGLPAFQTTGVIIARLVDADELLGACFVGNQSDKGLQILVATPLFCYWIFGSMNLASGFLVYRRNNDVLRNTNSTSLLLLLQTKCSISGVFLFVYCLPYSILLLAVIYEFVNIDVWLNESPYNETPEWPFLTRVFMELLLGIICSAWILGPKISSMYKHQLESNSIKTHQTNTQAVSVSHPLVNYNSKPSCRTPNKEYSTTSYKIVRQKKLFSPNGEQHCNSNAMSMNPLPDCSVSRGKMSQNHLHPHIFMKSSQKSVKSINAQHYYSDETIL